MKTGVYCEHPGAKGYCGKCRKRDKKRNLKISIHQEEREENE